MTDISPAPYGPTPSPRQLAWHKREYYGFIHFTTNTFTDKEWGYGDESPEIFNPSDFDADQIASTAAKAGMTGLILTCKHHDGFCLWPSKYTEHSVKNSPWRDGKGDVVREISDACRRHDIGFGVYLSPWDRNHAEYGRPAYIEYFRNQLHELTTEYGELFEVWFDGANGGDGYYGGANETRSIDRSTYYDWEHTREIVRRNQPNAVMFSDAGPDIRWVGNEKGIAGDPCWSTIDQDGLFPGIDKASFKTRLNDDMVDAWDSPNDYLNAGDRQGTVWLPTECDVSIRPGWFYHATEDDKVRTPDNLLDLYLKSVGRGASLLVNLPPDRRGLIHESDVASLHGFRQRLDAIFGNDLAQDAQCTASNTRAGHQRFAAANLIDGNPETYWSTDDDAKAPELILEFSQPTTFSVVGLREFLPLGQRITRFAVDVDRDDEWSEWCSTEAVGCRRLVRGERCTTTRLRVRVVDAPVCPALSALELYSE
ncbi:MAG: alpha-L-fucosidase [Verrucomicrobia bacterium]|jgi:alpha-L-fucosidase|nr:alpha-L-fucosidase [Verrucomicrobiota bacterium]MBT7066487.1 alpha-L-fucosidase [Verrucomicrobiota bacterium]MBT7698963.1 alpha-L-fucosidase [Verrucomicrobiota bacterium]